MRMALLWLQAFALLSVVSRAQTLAAPASETSAMSADAHPGFEVATIKPSQPDDPGDSSEAMGHRVAMSNTTVLFLTCFAYDVQEKQIANAPGWISTEKFDLNGVADKPGTPNLAQLKGMLQKLLADRFQLRFHQEQRELPAYVLTVAKNGSKLQPIREPSEEMPSLLLQPGFPKVAAMKARNMSMADFARLMQGGIVDRPVVDKTGLDGRFDFLLRWTPDESQFTQVGSKLPAPSETADAPSLFIALQQQLGLKFTAERKTPVEVIVVDRISKPSEN